MTQTQDTSTPYKALAEKACALGLKAVALCRCARRLEDRGHSAAAGVFARELELWVWWMLSALTQNLEANEAETGRLSREEQQARDQAMAMLSIFFVFLTIARHIQGQCGSCALAGEVWFELGEPCRAGAPTLSISRPAAHARAAWYAQPI